jgi:hypothetical protein
VNASLGDSERGRPLEADNVAVTVTVEVPGEQRPGVCRYLGTARDEFARRRPAHRAAETTPTARTRRSDTCFVGRAVEPAFVQASRSPARHAVEGKAVAVFGRFDHLIAANARRNVGKVLAADRGERERQERPRSQKGFSKSFGVEERFGARRGLATGAEADGEALAEADGEALAEATALGSMTGSAVAVAAGAGSSTFGRTLAVAEAVASFSLGRPRVLKKDKLSATTPTSEPTMPHIAKEPRDRVPLRTSDCPSSRRVPVGRSVLRAAISSSVASGGALGRGRRGRPLGTSILALAAACSSARNASPTELGLAAGSFASIARTGASSSLGSSGDREDIDGASLTMCATNTAVGESPMKGGNPVSSSWQMTPKA